LKFAVKRTWPKTPQHWEFRGEADSAKTFALRFAEARKLAEAVELVVIEEEGDEDDRATRFYRVVGTEPYALKPADPRPINPGAANAAVASAMPATVQAAAASEPTAAEQAADDASRSALEMPPGEKEDRAVEVADLRPFGTFMIFSLKLLGIFVAAIVGVRAIRWLLVG
jgi:hypothetical protein